MGLNPLGPDILKFLDGTGPQELCQIIRACRTRNPTCPPTRTAVYNTLLALRDSGDVLQTVDIDGIVYYQLNR